MDLSARKVIVNLFFYTLAGLALLFSIFFMVKLYMLPLATYQMVIYNIFAVLVILSIAAIIVAALMKKYYFAVGFLVYALLVLFVIMFFILFANMQVEGIIASVYASHFRILVGFSLWLTVSTVILYFAMMSFNQANIVETK